VAPIRQAHYEYRPRQWNPTDGIQQELIETRYEIDCPRCGYRVQVERSAPTSTS
jgi:DNA-directed RNA polymerase subunit RPC12/RpoP